MTWLLLPPHQSLAFVLADNGFDVWIANTRGTKYSRGHVSLDVNDPVNSLSTCCCCLSGPLFPFWFAVVIDFAGCLVLLELVMG